MKTMIKNKNHGQSKNQTNHSANNRLTKPTAYTQEKTLLYVSCI